MQTDKILDKLTNSHFPLNFPFFSQLFYCSKRNYFPFPMLCKPFIRKLRCQKWNFLIIFFLQLIVVYGCWDTIKSKVVVSIWESCQGMCGVIASQIRQRRNATWSLIASPTLSVTHMTSHTIFLCTDVEHSLSTSSTWTYTFIKILVVHNTFLLFRHVILRMMLDMYI